MRLGASLPVMHLCLLNGLEAGGAAAEMGDVFWHCGCCLSSLHLPACPCPALAPSLSLVLAKR